MAATGRLLQPSLSPICFIQHKSPSCLLKQHRLAPKAVQCSKDVKAVDPQAVVNFVFETLEAPWSTTAYTAI